MHHTLGRHLSALALSVLLGCSLVVDVSDIDRNCEDGRKLCMGHCALIKDPAYGCTRDGCQPCGLANAISKCQADEDQCEVKECLYGYGCPTMTGCLTNILLDEDNCGGCGVNFECAGDQTCRNGVCVAK